MAYKMSLIQIHDGNPFEKRCHYHGPLRNHHNSSNAVTGCLDKDDSQIEITVLSDHTKNKVFRVDLSGYVEIIENPFRYGGMIDKFIVRLF